MYKNISPKQQLAYIWWRLAKFKYFKRVVFNGAIRTGKTDIGIARGFIDWAFDTVHDSELKIKGWNRFFVTGFTKTNVEETVIDPMIGYCRKKGYIIRINRTTGYLFIRRIKDNTSETVIIRYFGMDNAMSFKRAQGLTYRGGAIDEAGLIAIKSIETLEGRCITFKDYKVFMTTNPEGDETHEFYEHYIKGGFFKKTLVLTFELLDNPLFTQEDEDYYRKVFTPTMFLRKIKGKWVRATGAIYKRFKQTEHVRDIEFNRSNYMKYNIGVDYGETDATVFTFTGIHKNYSGVDVLKTYYHKNDDYSDYDVTMYVEDFVKFAKEAHKMTNQVIQVYTEINMYRLLKKDLRLRGICKINKAIKRPEYEQRKAIQERINITNVMFGADYLTIDTSCRKLIGAFNNTPYDKKGIRLDDATTDVDSLDSFEYSIIPIMKHIYNRLVRRGVIDGEQYFD